MNPISKDPNFKSLYYLKAVTLFITRVLVGVEVAEIVGLLAELNLSVASSELFDQETVVGLDDLPYQLSWNCRHFEREDLKAHREN